jgi:hypothetical protein
MKGESIARVRERQNRASMNRMLEMDAVEHYQRHEALMKQLAESRRKVEQYVVAQKEQQAPPWWQFWRNRA